MRIGIITFYRVPNFGANLQAISTYKWLKQQGHTPIFMQYVSRYTDRIHQKMKGNKQLKAHFNFIDSNLEQTGKIFNSNDLKKAIDSYQIDAIIVGSDAVGQHHPLFSTLRVGDHWKKWIRPLQPERRFPNVFWTCGFTDLLPIAFMSVSCQNSPHQKFSTRTKKKMCQILNKIKYVSARDSWTVDMYKSLGYEKDVPITPDPVFSFNQNVGRDIPSKEEILERYRLPDKYSLIGLKSQVLNIQELDEIKSIFAKNGIECVSFPISEINNYEHPYKYEIKLPLSPMDWYAIIKYSSAYIGSNMHPIVICLHNSIPCFSLDNWGSTTFWGKKINDNSSKVFDILNRYGIPNFRAGIENGKLLISVTDIMNTLMTFPTDNVKKRSVLQYDAYNEMMHAILKSLYV